MAILSYLNFDLLIERTGDRYRARVLKSPGGEASLDFDLPFSREQLQIFILKAVHLGTRRQVRRIESPDMEEIKTFGRQLFESVFDDQVHDCLRLSLHEAEQRNAGLRIRIRLDDAHDETGVALSDVPWEFMYDSVGTGFLCLSSASPVVRYQHLRQPIEPVAVTPPLRLLVMISAPRDAPQLDVENEQQKLDEALRVPSEKGLVSIDRMEVATLEQLQRRLRVAQYHAFHFIGHGGYDERSGAGVLLLEDERGRSDPVSAEFLRTLFQNHRTLQLAILNACEGARTDPSDPFAGVAQSLVRGGVTAVIAMQFEISDDAAIILTSEFYSALADGLPVDAALAEARTAVYTRASAVEWAVPVLYLRSSNASIFEVEDRTPPIIPPVHRTAPSQPGADESPQPEPPPPPPGRSPRRAVAVMGIVILLVVAGILVVQSVLDGTEINPPPTPPPTANLLGQVVFVQDGKIMGVNPDTGKSGTIWDGDAYVQHFAPSVSRDGKQVLFTAYTDGSDDNDDALDVFRVAADGSGLKNLTSNPGADAAPDWSRDETEIVFQSARGDGGDLDIYVMNADGDDPRPLTENDVSDGLPDWAPVADLIAFERGPGGKKHIWVMRSDGSNEEQRTFGGSDDGAPVWSPQGERILFRSRPEGADLYEAWVMNAYGSSAPEPLIYGRGDVRAPAWSPDGSQIVFARDRGGDGQYDLYVRNMESSATVSLIRTRDKNERGPTWCCFGAQA
jgi:hypothetical protein